MASRTPNPHPSRTVWTIIGVMVLFLVGVFWLALSHTSTGFFRFAQSGGLLPAGFVVVALVVGTLSVALFLHRDSRPK